MSNTLTHTQGRDNKQPRNSLYIHTHGKKDTQIFGRGIDKHPEKGVHTEITGGGQAHTQTHMETNTYT